MNFTYIVLNSLVKTYHRSIFTTFVKFIRALYRDFVKDFGFVEIRCSRAYPVFIRTGY